MSFKNIIHNRKLLVLLTLIIVPLVLIGVYVLLVGTNTININDSDRELEAALELAEEKNQQIESALSDATPPNDWAELDCSVNDNSISPGSASIKTTSLSPQSDPAKDCDDASNVFYVTYGVEMPEPECSTPPQISEFSSPNPEVDQPGCEVVELGARSFTREINFSKVVEVIYTAQDDRLLSIKYYSGEDYKLSSLDEVESYIETIEI